MRWWDSAAWDGTTPWLMFLPMLWPIVMIGGIIVLVMLLMRRENRDAISLAARSYASDAVRNPQRTLRAWRDRPARIRGAQGLPLSTMSEN
jgi:hypothetical protein